MNSIVKNTCILTAITLISGLLLGIVYDVTKGPIAASEENTKKAAYLTVFSEASSFNETDFDSDKAMDTLASNDLYDEEITGVIDALDSSNNILGHVITVVTHEGYGGDIFVTIGVATDGTVKGVEITSISETAGLGMRANTDEFKTQFKDKLVDLFVYSKTGASNDNEIDALSGATITTNAMTNAVNSALVYAKTIGGEQ